ncbi:hypothetical protein [Micromonospora sp. WMMA1996]|uniref:hypothetical protein n=1 Tax=Micromonospora sp. WMMA1996 TaxID=2039878 RepID=UPI0020D273E7|nr:hypothetical protein [Micromonospora sp. WMMA1996]
MAYFATQAGVVGRAAGDDEDLVDVTQVLLAEAHLVERDLAGLGEPTEQRVAMACGCSSISLSMNQS